MVTSSPLANTWAAASGSIQMLNSAEGVMFPSAIAPPMSTMRSTRSAASGRSASRSATFVSGPSGTRVTGVLGREQALGEEFDRVLLDRSATRGGEIGAVQAGLAVRVGRDDELAHERPVGAGRDGEVGSSGELEHAEGIGGDLVERLVPGDGRDAEDLELGAGEREQEGDRVVLARVAVDEDGDHARTASGISTVTAARSRPLGEERVDGEGGDDRLGERRCGLGLPARRCGEGLELEPVGVDGRRREAFLVGQAPARAPARHHLGRKVDPPGNGQADVAVCAVDPQLVVEVGAHRALDRADDAVFVLDQPEDAGDGPVALAGARDRLRTHGAGAGEAVAGIDAVAGDVVRRPAAELDALAPVTGGVVGIGLLRIEDAEGGVDAVHRADLARREQLVDPGDRRVVAVHVALRDERSCLGRGRPDVERLVAAERQRLLTEDGPHARIEAAEHLLAVEVRPGGEQHAVELVLGTISA